MTDSTDEWIDKACAADPLFDDLDIADEPFPAGPSPTQEEIDAACAELTRWQSPDAFHNIERPLRLRSTGPDFFLQPQLKFLHEAYVIAKFAAKVGADQVRLAERRDQWPDGFVRIGKCAINVEVTSTHGGRKLGEEYRKSSGWRVDPVQDWHARADSIPEYLNAVITDKVSRYGDRYTDCWLVVYLNIDEWGVRQQEVEQVITDTMARYRSQFRNISVLWKGKLYSARNTTMLSHT